MNRWRNDNMVNEHETHVPCFSFPGQINQVNGEASAEISKNQNLVEVSVKCHFGSTLGFFFWPPNIWRLGHPINNADSRRLQLAFLTPLWMPEIIASHDYNIT